MGSTEVQLNAIINDLGVRPQFIGIFDKRFPGFIHKEKPCCAIVNTAGRETGGMHWLAMGWEPASKSFYFFDPFGFSDEKLMQIYQFEYEGLLKRSAIASTSDRCINFIKSKETVQGPHSAACGLFCCMFLHAFVNWPSSPMDKNPTMNLIKGVPNSQLNSPQSRPILFKNQQMLYEFLNKKSQYFRNNRAQIEFDTAFDKVLTTMPKM